MIAALDMDAVLDDILSRWHHWASQAQSVRGFAAKALVCGDYKTSRQYDDANGALDSDIESQTMRAVDFQVSEMVEPYRSAIHANARNVSLGRVVWSSPRLPADATERIAVVALARKSLRLRLTSAGVI